jgi:hypothetical protein
LILEHRSKNRGFSARAGKLGEPERIADDQHRYLVRMRVEKPGINNHEAAQQQFEYVLAALTKAAKKYGWTAKARVPAVTTVGRSNLPSLTLTQPEVSLEDVTRRPPRPPLVIPKLTPEALARFFGGVYERDAHIRLIHDALGSYADSLQAWKNDNSVELARSHVLLRGKPAGAKTMLLERFKSFLEQENMVERATFVDMHMSTKAGLENWLLDKAEQGELAEIIVLEEIDKVQPLDALMPLVSIMGSGYLAKMNAHIGSRREIANVFVMATCNDEDVIKSWRRGVLWSRFAHRLFCPRPSRELMRRILLDKVEKMGGNPLWVDKVLEFGYDLLPQTGLAPMDDPRTLKGLLDGGDRLLDNSYQLDLLAIIDAEASERTTDEEREEEGGFGDPALNKEVERAAIEFVTTRYQQEEWQVESVETRRLGFDLLARRGHDERHLEVKGLRGGEVDFILTAGEKRRAEVDPAFVCCVLTSALSPEPGYVEIPAQQLLEGKDFTVVAYRVRAKPAGAG